MHSSFRILLYFINDMCEVDINMERSIGCYKWKSNSQWGDNYNKGIAKLWTPRIEINHQSLS